MIMVLIAGTREEKQKKGGTGLFCKNRKERGEINCGRDDFWTEEDNKEKMGLR
jgi:hypothetical protein